MNIVFYVSGFAETAGGVESFILNAFDSFKNCSEHNIKLLTRFAYTDSVFYKTFCDKGYTAESIGIQHLTPFNANLFKERLAHFFRENEVDILHIHGTDEPYIVSLAKKSGIKRVILHAHTPSMELNGRNKNVGKIKKICRRKNEKKADLLVGCSYSVLQAAYSNKKKNMNLVIANGVDVDKFRFDNKKRLEIRKKYDIEKNFVVGHVGRFFDVKYHKFLIRIFNDLKNRKSTSKLILIGTGPLENEIKALVKSLKLENDVIFLGERNDISTLLNALDCIIFPSKFEGLSITLVEAQCNGLPCVVSDGVSDETKITDLLCKLSLNEDVKNWSNLIISCGETSNRVKYAKEVIVAGYDIGNIKERLLSIYSMPV